MKSKRRHELQTNTLADFTGKLLKRIEPYSRLILGVLIVGVAVGVVWTVIATSRARAASEAWRAFYASEAVRDPEALVIVAEEYSGTTASLWALLTAGDIRTAAGSGKLFEDRVAAEADLHTAKDNYMAVLREARNGSLLQRRAQLGMAQAHEALSEVDDAIKFYRRVAEGDPESALGLLATERLERLDQNQINRWYLWFARQQPRAALPGAGDDPLGGGGTFDPSLLDLPDTPDLGGTGEDGEAEPDTGETGSEGSEPEIPSGDEGDTTETESPDADSGDAEADPPVSLDGPELTGPDDDDASTGDAAGTDDGDGSERP